MTHYVNGADLSPETKRDALRTYVHRYTGDNSPMWAMGEVMKDGKPYPLQFGSDADWLANTEFPVTRSGRLTRYGDHRDSCFSRPTWPHNPELRTLGVNAAAKQGEGQ